MRYVQGATQGAMRKNTGFYTQKRLGGGIMAMGDDGTRGVAVPAGHGQLCRLPHGFDRAFDDFLQKARSVAPATPRFRPCL